MYEVTYTRTYALADSLHRLAKLPSSLHHSRTSQEPFWPEGLGINRGMHNALDAVWVGSQWSHARHAPCGPAAKRLLSLRQRLYESKTLQMHGKNRSMLLGYRADNSKGNSPKPAYDYTPNPASRYNMVPS